MSVQAISWVMENSEATLGTRLVLIALANHAHTDGTECWASVGTLAHSARLSERQTRRCLRQLEEMGEIEETGKHKSGTHIYRVPGMGDKLSGADISDPKMYDLSPKPLEPKREARAKALTSLVSDGKRDELWDALVEVIGSSPQTPSERGAWNKALKELRGANATPEQIERRALAYNRRFSGAALTPNALAKHWGSLTTHAERLAALP